MWRRPFYVLDMHAKIRLIHLRLDPLATRSTSDFDPLATPLASSCEALYIFELFAHHMIKIHFDPLSILIHFRLTAVEHAELIIRHEELIKRLRNRIFRQRIPKSFLFLLFFCSVLKLHKKRTSKKVFQKWLNKNKKQLMLRKLSDKPKNSKMLCIMVSAILLWHSLLWEKFSYVVRSLWRNCDRSKKIL